MSNDPSVPTPSGVEVIRAFVATLGDVPGVYRMLDKAGAVLYVGKAKSLKKRVTNYTQPARLPVRIQVMIGHTARMEATVVRTEAEALLLEANLIKTLGPRYNILLRDDKSFPYILITGDHAYPRIVKHRGERKAKGEYFGPFASAGAVNQAIVTVQRAFQLRPCADTVFAGRTRPCLQYQIKRCSGPCVGKIDPAVYTERVAEARAFLKGESRALQERLAVAMQDASDRMDYEAAASLRDRMRALTQVQTQHALHAPSLGDADVIAVAREGKRVAIAVGFFRGGQNYGSKAFFPSHGEEATTGEVLEAFLGQFYQNNDPAPLLMLGEPPEGADVLEEALTLRAGRKVRLVVPQRGEKRDVLTQVELLARQALVRRIAENAQQEEVYGRLSDLFGLDGPPERIEVYDNSHIRGRHALGAMIVAGPEGLRKKAYRTFDIKDANTVPGDDYAMMREVLTRRFRRLDSGDMNDTSSERPDLVLIDGGLGQLGVAVRVLEDLGHADIPVAAIAKGPERNAGREKIFLPGREPFQLEHADAVLHFLQRLRDEAHRFAIGAHRGKRSKAIRENALAAAPGIGPVRRKELLQYFGSVKAVSQASVDELSAVPGMSRALAERLYAYFR